MIAERFERLKAVVDRSSLARHQARVGRTEEVLVEGVSRRDEAMLTGRTRQGKLVHFAAAGPARHARRRRAGPGARSPRAIRTTSPAGCEEVTARPRHRVRIPVAGA